MRLGAAAARRLWRAARAAPVVGAVLRGADRLWWLRAVVRSGLVDPDFYAAQRGRRRMGGLRAAVDYVTRGHRAGLSPNPLFDEAFVGRQLPDRHRVPALYAYLVSDRVSVRVHPFWDQPVDDRDRVVPEGLLEAVWDRRADAVIAARVHDTAEAMPVARWRALVADALVVDRLESPDGARRRLVRSLRGAEDDLASRLGPLTDLPDTSLSVAAVGVPPSTWSALAIAHAVSAVDVRRWAADTELGAVVAAQVRPQDDVVVLIEAGLDLAPDRIGALCTAARDAAVMPALLGADGTVAGVAAGIIPGKGRGSALAELPAEDLDALGADAVEVPLLTGATFAAPAEVLRAAAALGLAPGWEAELVSLAARERGIPVKVDAGVRGHAARRRLPTRGDVPPPLQGRDDRAALEALWGRAGLEVVAWHPDGRGAARAALRWSDPARPQRWAIKTSAPAGAAGAVWGDAHFARGLAAALRRRGHDVVVDAYPAAARRTTHLDDVHLVVRGPFEIAAPRTGVTIEWIISHPDEITPEEVAAFDLVFAVSPSWARRRSADWGVTIRPLLECTDTDNFQPHGLARTQEVVFVGTARGIARPSVVAPLAAGIDVRVYGPDWRGFIPARAIAADTIPNTELSARYETAGVVLNDHWPAMRREGFMAMRPFDVVASGGRVISESVDGLAEVFGPAVVEYDTPADLVALLRGDLDALFPGEDVLREIAARVRREHSFDARARELDAAVESLPSRRSSASG